MTAMNITLWVVLVLAFIPAIVVKKRWVETGSLLWASITHVPPTVLAGALILVLPFTFSLPLLVMTAGGLLNFVVIAANNGQMPIVGCEDPGDNTNGYVYNEGRLLWLADRSCLLGFSIGDLVALVGFAGVVIAVLLFL